MQPRTHTPRALGRVPIVLTLLLPLLVLSACRREEPLHFSVVFESADGLEEGMPVVHRGLEIGEITDVGLDEKGLVEIHVEVENEYRGAVARSSIIRSESYGLRRRLRLSIEDGPGERVPVENGDVLVGRARLIDDMLSRLQDGARAAWEKTTEAARDLQESLEEAAQRGEEELRRLQRERAPELRRQAETVRDQLEEAGLEEEAARYWEQFEAWLDSIENPQDGEAPPLPEAPEVPPGR